MSFERPSSEEPKKEPANAEREHKNEELQEALDLNRTENWIGQYAAAHDIPLETPLGEFLERVRKNVYAGRKNPERIVSDDEHLKALTRALPESERPETIEMAIAPENTHENPSEGALSLELRKGMTMERVLGFVRARKQELVDEVKGG